MSQGHDLHSSAEAAREKGDFIEALKLIEEASEHYLSEGDFAGFSEIQGSRFLTLRHLYEKTGKKQYLILAKNAAVSAVELAEMAGDPQALALPYYNLAKAHDTLGNLREAILYYEKAIKAQKENPRPQHAREAVLLDMMLHLASCKYQSGEADAIDKAMELVERLKASDEPKYNKDVWVSGAYMRFAEALYKNNKEQALTLLSQAQEVIDSNTELVLRQKQLDALRHKISSA